MDKKALKWRVFQFLNNNPTIKVKRCVKEFKNESDAVVRSYYMMWQQFMKPLRWVYLFMIRKWEPRKGKTITLKDKVRLREIEGMIGVE